MNIIRRVFSSKAGRNATASYFAFVSTTCCGLLSIPVAVHFLEKKEIGLWTLVNTFITYLLWLDLGVGNATGRKIADAVTSKDQQEIDKWWTATRAVLLIQALVVLVVGFCLLPFLLKAFGITDDLRSDAIFLFSGAVSLSAVSIPMRGVPGLMIAQERFHWIPFSQGITPWLQLGCFAFLLNRGWGLRAYVPSMAATVLWVWVFYNFLVWTSAQRPRWNRHGIERNRLRSLFGFSLNLSVIALIESLVTSLPTILLARFGGLATVPVYTFTSRAPLLLSNLVQKTYHSFYPGLLRLYVTDDKSRYVEKYNLVFRLVSGVGLFAAAGVMLFNRTFVELLAGPDFYAGTACTLWFSIGVLMTPPCAMLFSLFTVAGAMGKSSLFATTRMLLGVVGSFTLYRAFGMAGIAATFAMIPLVIGFYGYWVGSAKCGISRHHLTVTFVRVIPPMALVLAFGGIACSWTDESGISLSIGTRSFHLPTILHSLFVLPSIAFATIVCLKTLSRFKQPAPVTPHPF